MVSPCHPPVKGDTKIYYLQMECLIRLVVVLKIKVKVTLRLAIYRQSDRLGQVNPCGHSPYVTSSLTRSWVCVLRICLAFRQMYVSHILKMLSFALYTSLLSVRALQSRACLSYVSYATTAA
jgi:hypothetical protein